MATAPPINVKEVGRLSVDAQKNVINWVRGCLMANKSQLGLQEKMDAIDVAYARYKVSAAQNNAEGVDDSRNAPCGNVFAEDDITPPIVVSQVDSYVAYLADVFLSGSPMFPVVSNPSNRKYAEQLETLMDDHALLGGYPRQFLIFLRDCVKYNYGAIECEWASVPQFNVSMDFASGVNEQKLKRMKKYFTKVKRLNPRNVIRDMSLDPGDIAEHGDYAGYVELLSKMKFKKLINDLITDEKIYNATPALASMNVGSTADTSNYHQNPVISKYVQQTFGTQANVNWDSYFDNGTVGKRVGNYGSNYEVVTIYGRILPSDMGIRAPQANTPQIWKFRVVNNNILISAERIISAYDYLPILFGQPLEDGMGYQAKSVAENAIEIQDGASTLFNIRFAAARRAVSDRALYVSDMISEADANARGPAPKIPVRMSVLNQNKTLDSAYKAIPFESRGLETVMMDAQTIVGFGKDLSGLNSPRQGQFQKGNKSVTEWNDTMAGSDNRLRLPALTLEHQVFSPFKSICVLNIFQYGENVKLISQKNGEELTINIDELRKQVLAFKVADGYNPKSKLASTEAIVGLMQMISQSQLLQERYGTSLPGMVAHLAQLQGIKGLEEYDPAYQNTMQTPAGLPATGPVPGAQPNPMVQPPMVGAPNGLPAETPVTTLPPGIA